METISSINMAEEVKMVLADNGGYIVKYGEYVKTGNGEYDNRTYVCREEIFAEKELDGAIKRMKELTKDED
jgi:hypothetical protein